MEVICKGYEYCEYNKNCQHAKLHHIKRDSIDGAENCTLLKDDHFIMPSCCYCDVSYARKIKLQKLKNNEKFSKTSEK